MAVKVIDKNISLLMSRFGQVVKWYPSRLCSCVGKNDGSYDPAHICNQGFFYAQPVESYLIRTQVNYKILNNPQGAIYNGGATLTIPKFYGAKEQRIWSEIAHGDIITISNKYRRDTDILKRGSRDYLQAFEVDRILNVYSGDTQYIEGIDFTVNLNALETESGDILEIDPDTNEAYERDNSQFNAGNVTYINWIEGKGPEEGEFYTVEFICKQQYKIWDDNSIDRGTTEDDLPKKVLAVLRRYVNPDTNVLDTYNFQEKIF